MSGLRDLEELVLLVRHDAAKAYIREAVNSYGVGAVRASIISTWIAVVFDIVEKLRELELTGDANAQAQVREFDRIHQSGDIEAALKFERGILKLARGDFEFISLQEYEDLARLQADRNRCAHPSMAADGIYNPPGELARYHLHTAVTTLLQHPPVQGKKALERLLAEIDSPYFPVKLNKAVTHFEQGPLQRPKSSLVRNLVLVVVKEILRDETDSRRRVRLITALLAIRQMHPSLTEGALKEKLSDYVREQKDNLQTAITLLYSCRDLWSFCTPDVQQRLEAFVGAVPDAQLTSVIPLAIETPALKSAAMRRVNTTSATQFAKLIQMDAYPPVEYVDRAIRIYTNSSLHIQANWSAQNLLIPCIEMMSSQQSLGVLQAIKENSQLLRAITTATVLRHLSEAESITKQEFLAKCRELGLVEHFSFLDTLAGEQEPPPT